MICPCPNSATVSERSSLHRPGEITRCSRRGRRVMRVHLTNVDTGPRRCMRWFTRPLYKKIRQLAQTERFQKRKVCMHLNLAKALMAVVVLGLATLSSSVAPAPQAAAAPAQQTLRQPDVIFVPTRQTVVEAMLKVANVKAGDVLYDLGSAEMGVFRCLRRSWGPGPSASTSIPSGSAEANENVKKSGVGDRVRGAQPGSVHDRHQRGHRRDALSVAIAQREAAADVVANAQARHTHRFA